MYCKPQYVFYVSRKIGGMFSGSYHALAMVAFPSFHIGTTPERVSILIWAKDRLGSTLQRKGVNNTKNSTPS